MPFSAKPLACKEIAMLAHQKMVQIYHTVLLMVIHYRASLDVAPYDSVHLSKA